MPEPRGEFEQQLEAVEASVIMLFAMVEEDLGIALRALLAGSGEASALLAQRDAEVDRLYQEAEELVPRIIMRQAPVAIDLRLLLSVVRVTPELERSHDLIVTVAGTAPDAQPGELSAAGQRVLAAMGELASRMWRAAADCWYQRQPLPAGELAAAELQMDELHARLHAELAAGGMTAPATVALTVAARCLARLCAHAVNVARRVGYLAGPPRAEPRP